MVTGGTIFSSKCTKKRLAAGLRPDQLGKLKRSPRPLAAIRGVLLLRGGEEMIVPIVPVSRKHHWYGADHGAYTDTLHMGPDRASYATVRRHQTPRRYGNAASGIVG